MSEYYDDPGPAAPSDGGLIAQLPSIIWQRKWYVIVPVVLAAIAAIAAVLVLPRQYESTATLLVESPSLPNEVIGASDNDVIDRRIESLRQQVISRPKLLELIEANELYTKERGRSSLSSVIEDMRDAISLKALDANLGGRPEDRTIAFRLAYRYADPRKAQTIAQSLMEQIIDLNSTAGVAQANQTVQFLKEQANGLRGDIAGMEQQIASLNMRYGGVLSRATGPIMGGGAGYDVQIADLTRANQALGMQRQNLDTADQRDPVVANAEASLAGARAVYAETHPDVIIAKQRLEEAKKLAAQNVKKLPSENIDEQITFNNRQIATLRAAKERDAAQVSASITSQSRAPLVQQQQFQLQQKLDLLNKQYDAVAQRLMVAQAGSRAADEQLGERLVVIDPPVVPDEPASPNRLLILGGGLAAGLAIGALLALAVEAFLHPIRTPGRVAAITGAPTLALVPVIDAGKRQRPGRWARFRQALTTNPFRRSKGEAA